MTRRAAKSFAYFLLMIIAVMILVMMAGCRSMKSANGLLRHADKDIAVAIAKGAKVTNDTTWATIPIISPEIKFETTIRPTWQKHSLVKDTLVAEDKKTGSRTKVKIEQDTNCPDSCNQIQIVYIKSDVPPQKHEEKVPVSNSMTIKAGHGFFYWLVRIGPISFILGCIAFGMFWIKVRAWLKGLL